MRELSLGTPQRDVKNDPTNTIGGQAVGNYVPDIGEMTEDIIFGAVNFLLGAIDDATGLDLLPLAEFIEGLLGSGVHLLTSFFNPISLFGTAAGIFYPILSGGLFSGSLIPGLDASKIVSGVFSLAQLPLQVLTTVGGVASSLITGVLSLLNIPNLPTSQITSGIFGAGFIPGLDASKIVSGVFTLAQLPATVLNSITGVASSLLSGVLSGSLIPNLDASKITSGIFTLAQLPATVLNSVTGVASSLISGVLGTGNIPGLDVSKIVSGVFGAGFIPGLDASKIVSGAFSLAQLPATVLNSVTGVASSLISGVLATGNIPGLDVSKIVSGVFGAGFIPGLDASKIVSGVFGLGSLPATVLNSVTGVSGSLINSLISGSWIPGLDASKITSGTFAQSIVSNLTTDLGTLTSTAQGVINGIVNGLSGLTGSLWTQPDADDALASQAAATAAAAAAISQIQGAGNQNNTGGLNASVDFSDYPDSTNLPSIFTETYVGGTAGSYGVISGLAKTTANCSGNDTRLVYGEYNVADTITDYQRVCGIWTGKPNYDYSSYPTGQYYTHHLLYARFKDVNNWVRIDFSAANTATLQFCVAGVISSPASVGHSFQPNVAYWLEAGAPLITDPYSFRVLAGGTPILSYNDTGHVSQLGALFRSGAMGVSLQGAHGFGPAVKPGPMLYFALQDNSPAGVVGSGCRVYRANVSTNPTLTGATPTINSFFDTIEYQTDEYTFAPLSGCRITVSKSDWYVVSARLQGPTNTVIQIFKNGTMVRQGSSNPAGGTTMASVIYLVAGDYVQCGASNSGAYAGNAAGTNSYLEITRVGKAT